MRRFDLVERDLLEARPGALDDRNSRSRNDVLVRRADDLRSFWAGGSPCVSSYSSEGLQRVKHLITTPWKRCPTLNSCIKSSRASFFPLHLRGSQWSKSCIEHQSASFSLRRERVHAPTSRRALCSQAVHRLPRLSTVSTRQPPAQTAQNPGSVLTIRLAPLPSKRLVHRRSRDLAEPAPSVLRSVALNAGCVVVPAFASAGGGASASTAAAWSHWNSGKRERRMREKVKRGGRKSVIRRQLLSYLHGLYTNSASIARGRTLRLRERETG